MMRITASEARKNFSDTLKKVWRGDRFLVSSHDKPVAAIISVEDLELLRAIEDKIDLAAFRDSLKEPGSVSWEDAKIALGLD